MQPVSLDEVRWTDGFWADRFETVRKRSIPAMWEIMKGTKYKPFFQHFLIAAGDIEGDYHGASGTTATSTSFSKPCRPCTR